MAVTRINNNQITDASAGNVYVGINANTKIQNYSITAGKIANNLVYGSDLTVSGNLTVNGQSTAIDTTITTIEDPVIVLASTQTGSPAVDIGFIGERGTSNNIAFVWDESSAEFVTAFTDTSETSTTVNIIGYANIHTSDANIGGNAVINGTTSLVGNLVGNVNATGNVSGGNLLTSGLISATGTITSGSNISGANILTGGLISATSTITSADTITGGNLLTGGQVSATGNITGGNIISGNAVIGNINVSGNITVNSLTSNTFVSASGNVVGGNVTTAGLVSATGTITSDATISGGNIATGGTVSAAGTATAGNLVTSGTVSATGTATVGNLTTSGTVSATGNVDGGNINTAGVSSATGNVTGGNILTGGLVSATGAVTAGSLETSGTANATGTITGGNISTGGFLSAVGTATVGNLATAGTASAGGNVTGANILTSGTVSATATITGGNIATGGTASATGNITGGNIDTGGLVSATGNIATSNFFIGNGSQLTGVIAASANAETLTGIFLANNVVGSSLTSVGVLGNLSVAGNTVSGNLATGGTASAGGNITGANILTGGIVSAAGNITGANVNAPQIYGSGVLTVRAGTGNINLETTGNVVLANTFINGVRYPSQDQDAASKIYVDNLVSTAISYHEAVVATTTTDLATATGGTITYAQPNGAANGIGATLTTTGSFNLIDTANVQTAGTRILVKNQANAVQNGVYVWSNATVITRASTEDTSGTGNAFALGLNDYFFTTSGNVNAGAAFIVDAPTTPIVFGTSQIEFAQFSSSQTYTANTAAGIVLNNQTFSAKVDNDTTAFDGLGNISVKAGANLTTPNIGAATGTSLSTTGTITGGNLATGGTVSAAGTATAGNIATGGTVSAAGNITAGTGSYFLGDGSLLTGVAAASVNAANLIGNTLSSNVTFSSLTSVGNLTTLSVVGTTQTGNLQTAGLVSATGDVTGGNLATGGTVSATGTATVGNLITGGTVSATGTATVGNVLTGGLVSATGNVTGANIVTGGLITSTGNVTGGNILTAGVVSSTGTVTGGNLETGGTVSATGTATVGNLITGGTVSATGTATVGNIATGGTVSATGTVTGGNINSPGAGSFTGNVTAANFIGNVSGNISAPGANSDVVFNDNGVANATAGFTFDKTANAVTVLGTVTGGNLATAGTASAGGNVTGANILTSGTVSATGDVTGGNLATGGTVSATGTATVGNLATGGTASATGNITGGNIATAGQLQGGNIVISGDDITDTNGRVNFNTAGADVDFAVNGDTVANVFYVDAGTGTASFGSATQVTNAIVNFATTTSFKAPVGNTAQRPAVGVTGMVRFNTTNNNLELYDNSAWTAVGVPEFTVIENEQFFGDGTTVAFTLGSTQTTNSCIVSINGVVQIPITAYSVSGIDPTCVLTFTEAPATGDAIEVRQITTTTSVTSIANASGNAVISVSDTSATTTITGDLTVTGNATILGNVGTNQIQNGSSAVQILLANGNVDIDVNGVDNVARFTQFGLNLTGNLNVSNFARIDNLIVNGTANYWAMEGNELFAPSSAQWNSNPSTKDDYITSAPAGFMNIQSLYANSTPSAELHLEQGLAQILVDGSPDRIWQFDIAGNLTIPGNIIPNANVTYSLGNTTNRFHSLYVGNSSIYIGEVTLGTVGNSLTVNGNTVVTANATGTSTTTGNVSIVGNITGSNIFSGGIVSAAGNVTGNYIFGNGSQLTGIDVTSIQNGTSSVSVIASGGNVRANVAGATVTTTYASGLAVTGLVSATGTVTGASVVGGVMTGSSVSVSGGVTAASVAGGVITGTSTSVTGTQTAASTVGGVITGSSTSVTGTQTAASTVGGVITGSSASVSGNVTGANFATTGTATIGGFTISGNTIVSSGANLTLDPSGPGGTNGVVIIQGNLQVEGTTTTINSNTVTTNDLIISVANNAINGAAANGGGYEVGPLSGPFITWLYNNTANTWVSSAGISAVGNIVGGNLSVGTGTITGGNIVNSNANGVGNIGSASTYFNTVFAKATSAQYADLAEKYVADAEYAPGTVVVFGGTHEVTVNATDADRKVAGVVSTNPSYIMNGGLEAEHVATVALTGRVPCLVVGSVRKGDMMVAAGLGRARAETDPRVGTVIGKALEDFDGAEGTIEVVVGRF